MKMPALSTVTYLTSSGGPTMVLNQNTNRGGNRQNPPKPTEVLWMTPADKPVMTSGAREGVRNL